MKKQNSVMLLIPIIFMALATLACAQDCFGSGVSVRGQVIDTNGNPIEEATIFVSGDNDGFSEAFEFTTMSDSEGNFTTDYASRFGCSTFSILISAEGYESQTLGYYPPTSENFPHELPNFIIIELIPTN